MQSAHVRGWPIAWNGAEWVYFDTLKPIDDTRPCKRCGRKPTPEGHDACLGHVDGVSSACCGHRVEPAYSVPNSALDRSDPPNADKAQQGGKVAR